jgi:hypothetical protein
MGGHVKHLVVVAHPSEDSFTIALTHTYAYAYHGYPALIHRLTYKRTNHGNMHVRGFEEEGSTTTPFDMVVRNHLDRFHLVADVIDFVPTLGAAAVYAKQADSRQAGRAQALHRRAWRRHARSTRLALAPHRMIFVGRYLQPSRLTSRKFDDSRLSDDWDARRIIAELRL